MFLYQRHMQGTEKWPKWESILNSPCERVNLSKMSLICHIILNIVKLSIKWQNCFDTERNKETHIKIVIIVTVGFSVF